MIENNRELPPGLRSENVPECRLCKQKDGWGKLTVRSSLDGFTIETWECPCIPFPVLRTDPKRSYFTWGRPHDG